MHTQCSVERQHYENCVAIWHQHPDTVVLQAELQQHLQELLAAAGVSNASQLLTASIAATWPRTARVNLLKMTVAEALSWLRSPPTPHQKLAKLVSMFWPAAAACRVLVT